MFTGIITAIGQVSEVRRTATGVRLDIASPWSDLDPGESVAVDGACLTVNAIAASALSVDVIATSLERTGFGRYAIGRRVNLERALRVGERLGGHLVQGHVDGSGTVVAIAETDGGRLLTIAVPDAVAQVSIPLGSVTVDGVSLTINAVPRPGAIQVSLIPFTLQHTTLGDRIAGDLVHLEGDMIGKYLRQLVAARAPETGAA